MVPTCHQNAEPARIQFLFENRVIASISSLRRLADVDQESCRNGPFLRTRAVPLPAARRHDTHFQRKIYYPFFSILIIVSVGL